MYYVAIESGKDYLSHHGVKGQRWGIRHDRVAAGKAKIVKLNKKVQKIKIKRQKNMVRLEKKRNKYDKFLKSRRGLFADKALIRQAKGVENLGLLGRHYLAKRRKMEFKIAKLQRKDYLYGKKLNKLDKSINKTKKKLNTSMTQTDVFKNDEYLSHHGVKGMRWGIRHDPERIGKVKKAIVKIGKTTIRGIKTARKAARRVSYNRTQRKIERAINSGESKAINKMFSKMSDSQTARAVNRMNQKDAVNRSRIEAGKRSLSNAKLQRKVDTLKLQNEYKKAKNPILYKQEQKIADDITRDLERKVEKGASYIGKVIIGGATTESGAAKSTDVGKQVVYRGKRLNVKRLGHSDFMDLGEEYLSHYGTESMKWRLKCQNKH